MQNDNYFLYCQSRTLRLCSIIGSYKSTKHNASIRGNVFIKYGKFTKRSIYSNRTVIIINTCKCKIHCIIIMTNDNKPPSRINFSKHLDAKLQSHLEWPNRTFSLKGPTRTQLITVWIISEIISLLKI